MKSRFAILSLLALLFSCENKDFDYGYGEYREDLAVVLDENRFLTDDGITLTHSGGAIDKDYKAGDRVYLHYSLLNGETGSDWTVRVNGLSKIPLGTLKPAQPETLENLPADPITLESVWIGSRYLNMQFYLEYHSVTHEIGLLADSVSLQNGDSEIYAYFKHDKRDDPAGYPTRSIISFDLEKALGQPTSNKKLFVVINTDNYGRKTYELNY
ncbi:MAG: hypothetical protein LBR64_06490 [Dysgonamonadaceae bacterium]|jgi:hypothetical protein|nr:hypothetical protein [Dysgonamonadaceae bacterium]